MADLSNVRIDGARLWDALMEMAKIGATPKGEKVTVRAELLEVDGRKLRFKVEAHDEHKKVGEGTHRRAIIAIQGKG